MLYQVVLVMLCKHQNVLVYKPCTMAKVFGGLNIVLSKERWKLNLNCMHVRLWSFAEI